MWNGSTPIHGAFPPTSANDNIAFRGVQAVQPAGILSKDSAPRNRHGQEQGIEPRVIEALTEIATRRHQHPFLASWNCGQGFGRPPRLPSAHAATENDDVLRELQQATRQYVEMILAFGDEHWRAASFERRQNVIENEIIPLWVLSEFGIKLPDGRLFIRGVLDKAKLCAPENDLVVEGPSGRLFLGIDAMTNRTALHEYNRVVAILPRHRRGKAKDVSGLAPPRDGFEAHGG
jgi:hypothetical protein